MMRLLRSLAAATSLAGLLAAAAPAYAQVYLQGPGLPLALANKAASAAVEQCGKQGFPVSVAVLDPSGEMRVFLKSDQATVHTKDSSFRKAYTIVTLGPIFKIDRSSLLAEKLRSNVNGAAFGGIPNVILLPGGVAVRAHDEVVASIGVSGSPDGMEDEACAAAGVDAIRSKLNK